MTTRQRILYVEDEPDIQMIARMALEKIGGYQVRICSSGEEALREAGAFAPDILLLDVMMPGMDGVSTLQALRKLPALAGTPAIFLTAKAQPSEVAHYQTMGAIGVIAKPFDPMTLASRIRTILATPKP